MSFRERDSRVEKFISQYLDICFYPRISKNFNRVQDKGDQLMGRDVELEFNNKKIIIDEKASIYYINKDIPTFAMEISFKNRIGSISDGWFINTNLDTTHYLLIWPFSNDTQKEGWEINLSDIRQLRCILIEKNKILSYLESKGHNINFLKRKADEIREADIGGPLLRTQLPYYFYYTKKLYEQPINLILRRPLIEELSDGHWMVNSESATVLK